MKKYSPPLREFEFSKKQKFSELSSIRPKICLIFSSTNWQIRANGLEWTDQSSENFLEQRRECKWHVDTEPLSHFARTSPIYSIRHLSTIPAIFVLYLSALDERFGICHSELGIHKTQLTRKLAGKREMPSVTSQSRLDELVIWRVEWM